jgi:hypothetical protein
VTILILSDARYRRPNAHPSAPNVRKIQIATVTTATMGTAVIQAVDAATMVPCAGYTLSTLVVVALANVCTRWVIVTAC